MKIQEADAKTLLVAAGLPVPPWAVARTPAEARDAAERYLADGAGRVVIKAQVLVGGRGKAGGVKLAGSPARRPEDVAGRILGMDIKGITVRKVLVGPAGVIVKEFYLGAILDRASRRIVLMASAEGGVEIEEVARVDARRRSTVSRPTRSSGCSTTRPASWPSGSAWRGRTCATS